MSTRMRRVTALGHAVGLITQAHKLAPVVTDFLLKGRYENTVSTTLQPITRSPGKRRSPWR